jgi:hypothetical protein
MRETPAETPVKMPVLEPMVATAVLLLVHIPPLTRSLIVTTAPTQRLVVPVITEGAGVTFTVVVDIHPLGNM